MEAADFPTAAPGPAPSARPAAQAEGPVTSLGGRARLGAALLGILLALIATAACAAAGLLLAEAFFGTTGGIL